MKRKTRLVWKRRLDATMSLVMLAVAGLAAWSYVGRPPAERGETDLPTGPILVEGLLAKGRPESEFGVIVFSDFQCPFCANFARNEMRQLERDVADAGAALIQFSNFPIESIHNLAYEAAQALECSRTDEAVSWKLHDKLFEMTGSAGLRTRADVDAAIAAVSNSASHRAISTCITERQTDSRLKGQQDLAHALGVEGTPTVVIGRREGKKFFPSRRLVGGATASMIATELRAAKQR